MARARTRAKRTVYLLLALAILLLLLELNRWLPGTWPGGGGGGFRSAGTAGVEDTERSGERDAPPTDEQEDPGAVTPPDTPPPAWPPKRGVVVEVRGPDGELAEGWRLGVGDGGAEGRQPDAEGTLRIRDKQVFAQGFRIRSAAGVLRHREGTDARVARWSIHLPAGKLPATARRPRVPVRVVDATTGKPIEGAQVDFEVGGMDATQTTDARGVAMVRVLDANPVEVRVRKEGLVTTEALLSPREAGTPEIAIDEAIELEVAYAPSPSSVLKAHLLDAEGNTLAEGKVSVRGAGTGQRATFQTGKRSLEGAWLETTVGTPRGTFTFRRPATDATRALDVPDAKEIAVQVREVSGRVVPNARVRVEMDTYDGPGAEDEPRTNAGAMLTSAADGTLSFVVPAGARTRLLVDVPNAAPMARTLTPVDGTDTLEFTADEGVRIPVLVRDADGRPLVGARVLARTSIEGMRLVRETVTDAQGRARLGTFAPGSVEVFAQAKGHAAVAQVADAASAMGTVELQLARGYPLRVVIEDPFGRALQDVDVEITPSGGGAPLVVMPSGAAHVTDKDGVCALPAVPDGRYDVTLTKPGYETQKLRKVRPGAVTYYGTLVKR
ncbi:MAG: carboxypeptidase-like regulatory domain-containing protein [Planctomycetota bacterium]|nr:carboxypeptidase-like regulatory domain-containing protein [Planctomycetota bacterium]